MKIELTSGSPFGLNAIFFETPSRVAPETAVLIASGVVAPPLIALMNSVAAS